jgi:hypothetical protein
MILGLGCVLQASHAAKQTTLAEWMHCHRERHTSTLHEIKAHFLRPVVHPSAQRTSLTLLYGLLVTTQSTEQSGIARNPSSTSMTW